MKQKAPTDFDADGGFQFSSIHSLPLESLRGPARIGAISNLALDAAASRRRIRRRCKESSSYFDFAGSVASAACL